MDPTRPCYIARPGCAGDLRIHTCPHCHHRNIPFCDRHAREHAKWCAARAAHPTNTPQRRAI